MTKINETINETPETIIDNNFDAEAEAVLEQRKKSFATRAVPKMKTIIAKLREIKGLRQFEKALANGAVTQEFIDKMEETIYAEWDAAKETLEYLRDLNLTKSSPTRSAENVEFSL